MGARRIEFHEHANHPSRRGDPFRGQCTHELKIHFGVNFIHRTWAGLRSGSAGSTNVLFANWWREIARRKKNPISVICFQIQVAPKGSDHSVYESTSRIFNRKRSSPDCYENKVVRERICCESLNKYSSWLLSTTTSFRSPLEWWIPRADKGAAAYRTKEIKTRYLSGLQTHWIDCESR